MTLLEQMERQRFEDRESARAAARQLLREVLRELIPNRRVFVFGTLTKAGRFTPESDIDLALEAEPSEISIYQLISLLSERMARPVDVILLDECRFKNGILREAEVWTPQD